VNTRLVRLITVATAVTSILGRPVAGEAAGPPHGQLVVSGSRSAHQDIVFARSITLAAGGEDVRYDARGSYAGFYLEPLDRDPAGGAGQVRPSSFGWPGFANYGLPLGRSQLAAPVGGSISLPAGRYRVHLITDAAAVVTIPVAGFAGSRTIRPRRLSTATARTADVTPEAAGRRYLSGLASFSLPVSVGPRSLAIAALHVVRDGHAAAAQAVYTGCIEADEVPLCRSNGSNYFDTTSHNSSESPAFTESAISAAYYFPDSAPTGQDTARGSVTTASTLRSVVGLAFALGL
jgi:hypothetical protein